MDAPATLDLNADGHQPNYSFVDEIGFDCGSCGMDFKRGPKLERASPFEALPPPPEEIMYPDGTPVFKFLPKGRVRDSQPDWLITPKTQPRQRDFSQREWQSVVEPDSPADVIIANGGGAIFGPAGTGKSYALKDLIAKIKARDEVAHVLAFTHSAAAILDGVTALRFLHEHPSGLAAPQKTWVIIDEISLCPLEIFVRLLEFHFFGVRFVVAGDFGQNLPIDEKWGDDAFLALERCPAMHQICKGLRVELTQCRRSDAAHFNFYVQFRGLSEYPGGRSGHEAIVEEMIRKYPWRREPIDICVCFQHKTRLAMARYLNEQQKERAEADGKVAVLVTTDRPLRDSPNHPHESMWIWPGQKLLGCARSSRPVKNQCEYIVVRADSDHVVVQLEGDEDEKEIRLDHHQCIQSMRLACARTAASVQGLTMRGQRLLVLSAGHEYMTPRCLYVVISRVTEAQYLHVASAEQQRELRRQNVA